MTNEEKIQVVEDTLDCREFLAEIRKYAKEHGWSEEETAKWMARLKPELAKRKPA